MEYTRGTRGKGKVRKSEKLIHCGGKPSQCPGVKSNKKEM
jgi:hypothetical protein